MAVQLRGAELIVRTLSKAGVEWLFTLSGNQIMPIFDATIGEGPELIHVRHEAAAVHMADAWGRITGQPGIALVTAGPGHANTLSALYVALAAESPLVLLSGHAPRSQLEKGAFQEMAQAEMAGHVTKASWRAGDAAQLGHELARAIRTAQSGRPGPVHLSLPFDLLESETGELAGALPATDDFQPLLSLLDIQTAEQTVVELSRAEKPLVLAGPSMTRGLGPELLERLSSITHLPVVGMESPRGINDPSLGAFAEVLAQADLILLLGKQLDFTLRFASEPVVNSGCRFIHIDPETRVLERTSRLLDDPTRLVAAYQADPLPALRQLIQVAEQNDWPSNNWCDEVYSAIRFRPAEWENAASVPADKLLPVEVCRAVQQFLAADDDAVFVSDGGEYGQWAQACIEAPHRLINGPAGSIGSSIPFAMTARIAFPDSRIVVTLGDGTFGFHPMEFETAVRHKLPFVAVVGHDACWNAERQIQLRDYGENRLIGCDLLPTRYDRVVEALGGHGEQVTEASQLLPALERAFASGLPACLNVVIQRSAAPIIRRS